MTPEGRKTDYCDPLTREHFSGVAFVEKNRKQLQKRAFGRICLLTIEAFLVHTKPEIQKYPQTLPYVKDFRLVKSCCVFIGTKLVSMFHGGLMIKTDTGLYDFS